jgi:hypothetical protein
METWELIVINVLSFVGGGVTAACLMANALIYWMRYRSQKKVSLR